MAVTAEADIHANDNAVLVSFELSQSNWALTSRLPGQTKMSQQTIAAGDTQALAKRLDRHRQSQGRTNVFQHRGEAHSEPGLIR